MKKGQEPAFPTKPKRVVIGQTSSTHFENGIQKIDYHNEYGDEIHDGMSTRLYLAGMILQGMMAYQYSDNYQTFEAVEKALNYADELIKQEEETR